MKKSIVLTLLPAFVLAGCSQSNDYDDRHTVPNPVSTVVQNDDGSYSKDVVDQKSINGEAQLRQSYEDAKAKGFNGSFDEWVEISELNLKDPEKAQQKAESSGYSGGDLAFAALAGLALGGLAAKNINHNSTSFDSHSQQRLNNKANYSVSQKYKEEDRRGGGGAFVGSSTAATTSASAMNNRSRSSVSLSKSGNSSSYSARSSSGSYGAVARGGFGGSSSGHGG